MCGEFDEIGRQKFSPTDVAPKTPEQKAQEYWESFQEAHRQATSYTEAEWQRLASLEGDPAKKELLKLKALRDRLMSGFSVLDRQYRNFLIDQGATLDILNREVQDGFYVKSNEVIRILNDKVTEHNRATDYGDKKPDPARRSRQGGRKHRHRDEK